MSWKDGLRIFPWLHRPDIMARKEVRSRYYKKTTSVQMTNEEIKDPNWVREKVFKDLCKEN